jgi:hypothetical protein
MAAQTFFGGKVETIETTSHADTRGILTALEFGHFAFKPMRLFLVEAPDGAVRGGHGHRHGRQLLLQVSGEIEIELRHAGGTEHVTLDRSSRALMIEAPVWSRQIYRGENPAMLVLSDVPFDPRNYLEEPK